MVTTQIEAEDFTLSGEYRIESGAFASGGEFIGLFPGGVAPFPTGTTGDATYEFTGPSGTYDIIVHYFDEKDGGDGTAGSIESQLTISLDNNEIDSWILDEDPDNGPTGGNPNAGTLISRTISGQTITSGSILKISGVSSNPAGEWARVDYLELVRQGSAGTLAFGDTTFRVREDGTAVAAVTVIRTDGNIGAVSATINLSNGTASGSDYDNSPILVNFADGDDSPKVIEVPIVDDQIDEGNETINLSLGSPTGEALIGEQDTAVLTIVDNDDAATGTAGDDVLRGTPQADTLRGLGGNDRLIGLGDDDLLIGGSGNDNARGGGGNDVLRGNAGNDRLLGGGGNDKLFGSGGRDILNGGGGNDILNGGGGNDTLQGGAGKDRLTGGKSRDQFILEKGKGLDIITDFENGRDKLGLAGRLEFDDLSFLRRGDDTLIKAGGQNVAKLLGVSPNQISAADFV